jgi:hypothetical protein
VARTGLTVEAARGPFPAGSARVWSAPPGDAAAREDVGEAPGASIWSMQSVWREMRPSGEHLLTGEEGEEGEGGVGEVRKE